MNRAAFIRDNRYGKRKEKEHTRVHTRTHTMIIDSFSPLALRLSSATASR